MTLHTVWQDPGLIDLLKQRHHEVQENVQKAWDEKNDLYISDSGWLIMACIYEEPLPISNVTRQMGITRQAIHKFIKSLSEKGLIDVYDMESNKKEKCVALTPFGKRCYIKRIDLKTQIEDDIVRKLGDERIKTLKVILQSDWGI